MASLTYAGDGVFDPVVLRSDVAAFFRRLRAELGGVPLPYAWVPEWHKDHGLHVHVALGRYVPKGLLSQAWGHGIVHIKYMSDLPVGVSERQVARRAAGYLSKYVSKSFADDEPSRAQRLHRYEVAQGFQPKVRGFTGATADQVLMGAVAVMGGELPSVSWSSSESEAWQGPPAVWFAWD